MKLKSSILVVIFVLSLFYVNISTVSDVEAQTTKIYVNPSILTVPVFDSFNISISVANVTDLAAIEFQMYWNSSLMNATSYATYKPPEWPNWFEVGSGIENDYNSTHGRLNVGFASLPATGFNGSHTFVDVSFDCFYVGECALDLADTRLWDSVGSEISHEAVDGYVIQEGRTPMLYFDPENVTAIFGEEFTVNLTIAYAIDLYCYDFKLNYNTSLLDFIEIVPSAYFVQPTFTQEINETIGRVWFGGFFLGNASSANGNGTLATLRFNCTSPGECILDLYDTNLLNRSATLVSTPPNIGDVDGDGSVNIKDVVMVLIVYGAEVGDPDYNSTRDLNNDGVINLFDLVIVNINFARDYNVSSNALLPIDNVIIHDVLDGRITQYITLPHGPTAIFTATATVLLANQSIAFNASYSLPGSNGFEITPIVEYAWDFETDGNIDSYGVVTDCNYTEAGYYTVTLNVTDSQGLWDTMSLLITVISPRPLEEAIEAGVAYLVDQQNPDGSWGFWDGEKPAYTGLVLTKLQMYAYELGYTSPFDPAYPYSLSVIHGWDYLFSVNATGSPNYAFKQTLSIQNHTDGASGTLDNPDMNGNGYGICFAYNDGYGLIYPTYTASILLMALDASGTPDRPNNGGIDFDIDGTVDTFKQFAQDLADWLAWAQGDSGNDEGGWSYEQLDNQTSDEWTDNSNSGYATLGLAAAEGFGCTIPVWVKTELNVWITNIQDPVNGHPNDGGSYYQPEYSDWCNELRTGYLIFQMAFSGDTPATPRFQNALDYVVRHWNDTDLDPGWGYNATPSNYQAMFCLMKGFEYSGITLIDLNGDSIPEHDWSEEFQTVLTSQQYPDGSWFLGWYGSSVIDSVWALLTLEHAWAYIPLTIHSVTYAPTCLYPFVISSEPRHGEPVRVASNITGVTKQDIVLLSYKTGETQWWNTTMIYNSTRLLWETVIPGQVGNTTVEFFITASNAVGNTKTSSHYYFEVISLKPGDINGDGWVNAKDAVLLGTNFDF